MKKTVLTAAIALALTTGLSAPAYAADASYDQRIDVQGASQSVKQSEIDKFAANPVIYLIGLLLPAVQKAR